MKIQLHHKEEILKSGNHLVERLHWLRRMGKENNNDKKTNNETTRAIVEKFLKMNDVSKMTGQGGDKKTRNSNKKSYMMTCQLRSRLEKFLNTEGGAAVNT